jgi:hypothetical protein
MVEINLQENYHKIIIIKIINNNKYKNKNKNKNK